MPKFGNPLVVKSQEEQQRSDKLWGHSYSPKLLSDSRTDFHCWTDCSWRNISMILLKFIESIQDLNVYHACPNGNMLNRTECRIWTAEWKNITSTITATWFRCHWSKSLKRVIQTWFKRDSDVIQVSLNLNHWIEWFRPDLDVIQVFISRQKRISFYIVFIHLNKSQNCRYKHTVKYKFA